MLNKKDFHAKAEGVRRIYTAVEEAQFDAVVECEDKFRIFFSKEDAEFITQIAMRLGFQLQVIGLDDGMAEYIFS